MIGLFSVSTTRWYWNTYSVFNHLVRCHACIKPVSESINTVSFSLFSLSKNMQIWNKQWQETHYPACNTVQAYKASIHTPSMQLYNRHSRNNVDCISPKVIELKTCFTVLLSQWVFRPTTSLTLTNIRVHKSNVNMPSVCIPTGDRRRQLSMHRITFTTQKQMTTPFISPPRHNTVPPNHLSSVNMTELRLE